MNAPNQTLRELIAQRAKHTNTQNLAKSSENAHPMSQITVWEGQDGQVTDFTSFDKDLFQVALLFINGTNIQPETPELQFDPLDNKEQRTLRICQLVALLLAHTTSGGDVTAVTMHHDKTSTPPLLEFVFTKNKEPVSKHDVERADKLVNSIKRTAGKSCPEFVTEICNYMASHCFHNQLHLSKHIVTLGPPLLQELDDMIKAPAQNLAWQFDFIKTNQSDRVIEHFAATQNMTPLEGLLALLTSLIQLARKCQKSPLDMAQSTNRMTGNDLLTLGKYTHILRESTLFLRFVDRVTGSESTALGMELWESFRTLELFHTSTILLWEQLNNEPYQQMVPHLRIIPANAVTAFDYLSIEKRYKLKVAEDVDASTEGDTIGPSLPVGDFWDFIKVRSKKRGHVIHGLRHDFLKRYPALLHWDGNVVTRQSLHSEVKLALDCLQRRKKGKLVIGVSKQKCLSCETWFDALNSSLKNVHFILAPGHKKVYPGWRFSRIINADRAVIAKVWDLVDKITDDVKRIEPRDLVPAMPVHTQQIELDKEEMKSLAAVLNAVHSEG